MNELMQNLLELQTMEFGKTPDKKTATKIAELRSNIPAPILLHYDRLRVRGKKGIAAVRHQVCTGCHMGLTLALVMTLKHDRDIQLCESCGRYLYLAEETESAVAPEPAPPPRRRKKKAAPVNPE